MADAAPTLPLLMGASPAMIANTGESKDMSGSVFAALGNQERGENANPVGS